MKKVRIDVLLVEKGLAESRNKAQRLVMAGQVRVKDQLVSKPAEVFSPDDEIVVKPGPEYVSRGGEKLAAAITSFELDIDRLVCADVGSSTGGFSDCLLQYGAERVYAIDVGRGVLHWKIRQDARVVVMEGVNARYLQQLPETVNLVTIDTSFISLKVLLPVVKGWFQEQGGEVVVLIKPQFEAGKVEASRGKGVIRDPEIHRKVLSEILDFASEEGYQVIGLMRSPIKGPKGNVEFLSRLKFPAVDETNPSGMIDLLFPDATFR